MASDNNINVPLETLLAMLQAEGIKDIGTTAVLDIQKVLASLDRDTVKDFRRLRYYIGPIVCRNKEDQLKFSQVFERFAHMVESDRVALKADIPTKKWNYRWWVAAAVFLVLAGLLVWWRLSLHVTTPQLSITITTYSPVGKNAETAVGDSVGYEVFVNDPEPGDKYFYSWQLPGHKYDSVKSFRTVFKDTGSYTVKVRVKDTQGNILEDSMTTVVLCEHPPYISLQRYFTGAQVIYEPVLFDPLQRPSKVNYKWFINDSLVSEKEKLLVNLKVYKMPYRVRLIADTRGLYCSSDSLVATYYETPDYSLKARSLGAVVKKNTIQMRNLLMLILTVLSAAGIAFVIARFWKKPMKPAEDKAASAEETGNNPVYDQLEGPFTIEFRSQDHKITVEENVERLADGFRKRQLSDVNRLDMRKSIDATIRAGGFPSFQFSPRTRPVDFLVLLDKERAGGHMVRLFEYLVDHLRTEQVNITLYEYYKEPLFVNNTRMNHLRLPVEKLRQLYPDTILLLFSTGEYLLEPLTPVVKSWVEEKLKWSKSQLIITPTPKKDWTYKETLLQRSGFTMIPADFYDGNLLKVLFEIINGQVESTKQHKIEIPESYSTRYINFQNFRALSKYLSNDRLLRWVSATAVYPNVDWNVTLAIGKAIEEIAVDEKVKLVNYENLLKISRISWMQDGVINDDLRLEMLNYTDSPTEAAARGAIVAMLEEIRDQFKPGAYAREEFELHRNNNLVQLHAYNPSNDVPEESMLAMKNYIRKGWLDWPQTVYLEKGRNTLIKGDSVTSSVSISDYLSREESKRETGKGELPLIENKERKTWRISKNTIAAGLFVLLCAVGLWLLNSYGRLQLSATTSEGMRVVFSNIPREIGKLSVEIQADTSYPGEKQNDSTFVFKNIKARAVTLLVTPENGLPRSEAIYSDSSYQFSFYQQSNEPVLPPAKFTCTIDSLPGSLSEIWSGTINNRLININAESKMIYYSTGAKSTYGTYVMQQVCLGANGVYRITTLADKQYQVFYLRNVQVASFELSNCSTRYNSMADIDTASTAGCEPFSTMAVYLPSTDANSVVVGKNSKVEFSGLQNASLEKLLSNVRIDAGLTIEININSFMNAAAAKRFEEIKAGFLSGVSSGLIDQVNYGIREKMINWRSAQFGGTPFDRDFIRIRSSNDYVLLRKINPYTTSKNPGVDITKQSQVGVGKDTIAVVQPNVVQTQSGKETKLGELLLDEQGKLNRQGTILISQISKTLSDDPSAKVRLEAVVNSDEEEKSMESYLITIRRWIVEKSVKISADQVTKKISKSPSVNQSPLVYASTSRVIVILIQSKRSKSTDF